MTKVKYFLTPETDRTSERRTNVETRASKQKKNNVSVQR